MASAFHHLHQHLLLLALLYIALYLAPLLFIYIGYCSLVSMLQSHCPGAAAAAARDADKDVLQAEEPETEPGPEIRRPKPGKRAAGNVNHGPAPAPPHPSTSAVSPAPAPASTPAKHQIDDDSTPRTRKLRTASGSWDGWKPDPVLRGLIRNAVVSSMAPKKRVEISEVDGDGERKHGRGHGAGSAAVKTSIHLLDGALDEIGVEALKPDEHDHGSDTRDDREKEQKEEEEPAELRPLSLLALLDDDEESMVGPRLPTLSPAKPTPTPKQTVPWDGQINWSREDPHAVTMLQYIPRAGDCDTHRAVRIEGIPTDMAVSDVLRFVSGELYSAYMVNTASIIGSNTVALTFATQKDAEEFLAKTGPILQIGDSVEAKVVPVHTPTYPIPADIHALMQQEMYTRCISVWSPDLCIKERVAFVLKDGSHVRDQYYWDTVERVADGNEAGECHVRFHSVRAAQQAYVPLRLHGSLRGCHFGFVRWSKTK